MAALPAALSMPPDRHASPGLSPTLAPDPNHLSLNLNLKSNNPFRNRTSPATSPSPQYNLFPQNRPPPTTTTRMSNNPFLDSSELATSPVTINNNANPDATNAFKDLSLLDKSPPYATKNGPPPRAGTMPIRPVNQDDRRDPRAPSSPNKRAPARPRRLSESSVIDSKEKRDRRERDRAERPERRERTESEERRRRERRKERDERHKRDKERGKKSDRPTKRPQGLDIIDKLDVTGIYGQGLFHHDGPFDACNPHRNARKNHKAPMQAFPEGSANMALGGSGPLRSQLDLDTFHGRGEEAFTGFSATRKANTSHVINPTDRFEQVHGDETYGLGTSTFLEGAPAPKSALQRRESDDAETAAGGILRKKSIAQRFRGMSNPRRYGPGEARSPEAGYRSDSPPRLKAVSAGGPARATYTKENEINPFDHDYSDAFERKGTQIRIAEQEHPANVGRPRAASNSKNGYALAKSVTADSAGGPSARPGSNDEDRAPSGGFLNRMKSLKGGRRARPERRDS